ncbi:uncharacterized protein LOC109858344 [Pseudomyrmex gracilis]|uniref:uncharacterized protein LOC109858344 n=1 Tax=Pseudomyrmex gracilis TaxID=219809 RepID=UPI000994FE45|nr:uncharacterized protein LOC109858344 [Pseudomyrmex gracilis]XP_020291076.1 uncharacterized protein LOC109858344 [Pseudomyrmex gracilis]
MTLPRMLLVVAYLLRCHVARSIGAPARATNQVLLGEADITLRDDADSDFTTEEPYLKKCIVDGNAYSHSQTIPSYDSNSHCLCVAGEVYCWWQNYNPSTAPSLGPSSLQSTTVESNYTPSLEMSTDIVDGFGASGDSELQIDQRGQIEINATSSTAMSSLPTTCIVMGREYRQGETLPHSTGNCIECSCGSEGRVECSPKDCVALRPEMLVAPDMPEAPDGDFEVFNLARDRGIDESF